MVLEGMTLPYGVHIGPNAVTYAAAVPVSRKRKKTRKSGQKPRPQAFSWSGGLDVRQQEESIAAMAGFTADLRQLHEHRMSLALKTAEPMIAELVGIAASLSDSDLQDELCLRIGRTLSERDENAPVDDYISPNTLAEAIIQAAANAVGNALAADTDWAHAWRVLTAAASTVNFPLSDQAESLIEALRVGPGGHQLPTTSTGPAITRPVLWTRDAYGSRFAVVAPFLAADQSQRWYLWDIDACGHHAFTVHGGYYASSGEALVDWQAGVGAPAADGTVLAPVDDPRLLDELMPRELGMMNPGGENFQQLAEYHRSKRLAEAVIDITKPIHPKRTPARADLNPATAVAMFTAWLREHRPERSRQDGLDELIGELADSWFSDGPSDLFRTCSPHRVAFIAEHVGNFYEDDFAADLIALLPDWTTWLADRNATPAHLADRCRPYAHGEPHIAFNTDSRGPYYLARITE